MKVLILKPSECNKVPQYGSPKQSNASKEIVQKKKQEIQEKQHNTELVKQMPAVVKDDSLPRWEAYFNWLELAESINDVPWTVYD